MQEIWTIQALVEWTTNRFAREGFEHPRLEAEVLLAHVLDADRVHLYVNYHQPVNQEERQRFRELVHRRLQGQPVAYLVGYREFYSLRFEVGPGVLVPRPETELLVMWSWTWPGEESRRTASPMLGPAQGPLP
ncbi:MAG: hypothetical protein NUV35_08940 [Syntrophomonadaceae bacterium]|nr:hypothetical protein [Syntrophomonadaceae bacterium]